METLNPKKSQTKETEMKAVYISTVSNPISIPLSPPNDGLTKQEYHEIMIAKKNMEDFLESRKGIWGIIKEQGPSLLVVMLTFAVALAIGLTSLEGKVTAATNTQADITKQINNQEQVVNALSIQNSAITMAANSVNQCNSQVTSLNTQITTLQNTINSMSTEITTLQNTAGLVSSAITTVNSLGNSVSSLQNLLNIVQNTMNNQISAAQTTLLNSITSINTTVNGIQNQIPFQLSTSVSNVQNQFSGLSANLTAQYTTYNQQLFALLAVAQSSGVIVAFGGISAPTGWLLCNGSLVLRADYSSLFKAIGTTYGIGDGSTTFALPNTQGLFLRSAGSQNIAGVTYSTSLGAIQNDQMQGHAHILNDPGHSHNIVDNGHNHGQNAHAHGVWNGQGTGTFLVIAPGSGNGFGSGGATYNMQGSSKVDPTTATNNPSYTGVSMNSAATGASVQGAQSDGTNGSPRIGSESRPGNIALNYIIKI